MKTKPQAARDRLQLQMTYQDIEVSPRASRRFARWLDELVPAMRLQSDGDQSEKNETATPTPIRQSSGV